MFRFAFGEDGQRDTRAAETDTGAPSSKPISARRIPVDSPVSETTLKENSSAHVVVDIDGVRFDLGAAEETVPVQPGIYEGGLELWECALDLARYLERHQSREVCGRRAIELGCGRGKCGVATDSSSCVGLSVRCGDVGLLGLWAIRRGATYVAFCDYNEDVLRQVTAHSVSSELDRASQRPRARLYAGDWSEVTHLLREDDYGGRFELILTAETTYRSDVARKLGRMIGDHLDRSGVAFVASKRYYFGTGGGSRALLDTIPEGLHADRVWVADDGASTLRDIYRITWNESYADAGTNTSAKRSD